LVFRLLVLKGEELTVSDKGALAQVAIHLIELDSESSDLDLVISPTSALDITAFKVAAQVTCAVEPIPRPLPQVRLPPGLVLADLFIGLFPRLVVHEPVRHELFAGLLRIPKVAFSETSRTEVNLAYFSHAADPLGVLPVHDEQLYVLHALSGRHRVLELIQKIWLMLSAWDLIVRHGTLSLS
jgi:hypothetical protein